MVGYCKNCSKEFRTFPSSVKRGVKYCSHSCAMVVRHREGYKTSVSLRGSLNPNWTGGKPICIDCGERCSHFKAKRCGNCWKLFLSNKTGERHHNWIADRTKLAILSNGEEYRNSPASREWSKNVRNRDKWSCRIADINCGGRLEAHHILGWTQYPELRYEVNNGITLCHFHHPRKRNDEMRLSPYFQELVGVKVN